jgi:Fe-S-cluster containining protein
MTDSVRQRVLAVYHEVDAVIAAAKPRCDASGRCCRFMEYGHTLFLTAFEAEILLESAAEYHRPVTRDGCPFQIEGKCTARQTRPLGCRIYFCDPEFQDQQGPITEHALAQLKKIAEDEQTGWHYAPLHVFLNDWPVAAAGMNNEPGKSSRMTLPLA